MCQQKRKMADLKKASKRVIVTSERVNYYGFRVLTKGINLKQYIKNPVLLWMHIRAIGSAKDIILPLGNVIDLRLENDPELGWVITGLPVFDLSDPFAKRIYDKYENGTIRMASAGLIPLDWSDEPEYIIAGQKGATLIKSVLQEISLCDIGGNDDAVQVALYNDANERIELSLKGENTSIPLIKHPLIENEMKLIQLNAEKAAEILGLAATDTPALYEEKIAEVVQLAQTQKTQIDALTRDKAKAESEVVKLTNDLAAVNISKLTTDTDVLLKAAVTDGKITKDEITYHKGKVKTEGDLAELKLFIDAKAANPSIQTVLKNTIQLSAEAVAGKSWDDLDKAGKLVQLKAENLPLFEQLYQTKFGKAYGS